MKAKDFYNYLINLHNESGILYVNQFELLDCFGNDRQDMQKALDYLQSDWTIHYYEPHEILSPNNYLIVLFEKLNINNLPELPEFVIDNINNALSELEGA